jgi:hypothetical protein
MHATAPAGSLGVLRSLSPPACRHDLAPTRLDAEVKDVAQASELLQLYSPDTASRHLKVCRDWLG